MSKKPSRRRSSVAGVRSKWWSRLAGKCLWCALHWLCMTLRIKVIARVDVSEYESPFILTMWHNRILLPPYTWNACFPRLDHDLVVLTSASKDGALVAEIVRNWGLSSIRGSTSRRGAIAFMQAMRHFAQPGTKGICFTPDGPGGPLYHVYSGAIKFASMSQVPIVCVNVNYASFWRLKTWDRFIIPKPFSEAAVSFETPWFIPPDLTEEQMDEYAQELGRKMAFGNPDFLDDCF